METKLNNTRHRHGVNTYIFAKCALLLLFLKSINASFTWALNPFVVAGIVCFILLVVNPLSTYWPTRRTVMPMLLYILVTIYIVRGSNLNGYIGALLTALPVTLVLLSRDRIKVDILKFLTSAIAGLLFVSLCAWVMFLLGVRLPNYIADFNNGQYLYNNYYLFLVNYKMASLTSIPRFSSVFLEPGHLGIVASLLMYTSQFDLRRKEVLVLLIATLLTFSLAGYVLLIISVTMFIWVKSERPIIYLVMWILALSVVYVFFASYNNGDNIVNKLIISRDGDIAGYRRFSRSMDDYYYSFIRSSYVYFGVGSQGYQQLGLGANAGYKVFLLQHGVVGLFLLLTLYLALVFISPTKMVVLLLLIYILSFLQRAYALWDCELIVFICAVALFSRGAQFQCARKQAISMPKETLL